MDERGIIVDWFGRLLLGFVVAALVLFEAGTILVNFFTLDNDADEIAVTVSAGISGARDVPEHIREEEARELARERGARLVDFEIDGQERVVRVTLRRRAKTLLIHRIDWTSDWGRATAEGQAGTI